MVSRTVIIVIVVISIIVVIIVIAAVTVSVEAAEAADDSPEMFFPPEEATFQYRPVSSFKVGDNVLITPVLTGPVPILFSFVSDELSPFGIELDVHTGVFSGIITFPNLSAEVIIVASYLDETTRKSSFVLSIDDTLPLFAYKEIVDMRMNVISGEVIELQCSPVLTRPAASIFSDSGLPAWLTLNTATGNISGTVPVSAPIVVTSLIQCTNGSAITLNVGQLILFVSQPEEPPSFVITSTDNIYTIGELVDNTMTLGSPTLVFNTMIVDPALPQGLQLDTVKLAIIGSPERVTPKSIFTITAENGAGIFDMEITIQINDVPPEFLYTGGELQSFDPLYVQSVWGEMSVPRTVGPAVDLVAAENFFTATINTDDGATVTMLNPQTGVFQLNADPDHSNYIGYPITITNTNTIERRTSKFQFKVADNKTYRITLAEYSKKHINDLAQQLITRFPYHINTDSTFDYFITVPIATLIKNLEAELTKALAEGVPLTIMNNTRVQILNVQLPEILTLSRIHPTWYGRVKGFQGFKLPVVEYKDINVPNNVVQFQRPHFSNFSAPTMFEIENLNSDHIRFDSFTGVIIFSIGTPPGLYEWRITAKNKGGEINVFAIANITE